MRATPATYGWGDSFRSRSILMILTCSSCVQHASPGVNTTGYSLSYCWIRSVRLQGKRMTTGGPGVTRASKFSSLPPYQLRRKTGQQLAENCIFYLSSMKQYGCAVAHPNRNPSGTNDRIIALPTAVQEVVILSTERSQAYTGRPGSAREMDDKLGVEERSARRTELREWGRNTGRKQ